MTACMAPRKEVSLSLLSFLVLVLLALGLGASYRLPQLGMRPMHTDEAILGIKLGEFWNTGHFQYDPKDFHGPALHQVSILWGSLAGWGDPSTWTEADLRLVVALCGLGVMLTTLLFHDALGRYGTVTAMLLTAASPMMVFYSRYFIMEMLLVLLVALMLGSFWRYSQGGTRLWLLLGGCALGFQHAAKETFVLNAGAVVAGWVVARVLVGDFSPPRKGSGMSLGSASRKNGRPARPWLWVLAPAALVSVASFSNGFRDWQPVLDSFTTYLNYLERSGGSGHEKPWHYYLTLLVWHKDTLVWTEAGIVVLAVVGMLHSVVGEFKNTGRQAFLVFISVYSLVLLAGYSILSYKTPWSILSAQHALTLLAGSGAAALWQAMPGKMGRGVFNLLLAAGVWHLCNQSIRLTGTHANPQFEYSADPRNPYVYSHTQKSLLKLMGEVQTYVKEHPEGTSIQVISQDAGWPLPWYWRTWPKVDYQTQVPENLDADVIVADADFYDAIKAKIPAGEFIERSPFGLRLGVIMTLFMRKPQPAPIPVPVPAVPPADAPAEAEPEAPVKPPEGTLMAPLPALNPVLPSFPGLPVPTKP